MSTLDRMTWAALSIVFILVGTVVGALFYPLIKYHVLRVLGRYRMKPMRHEGVDTHDVTELYPHLQCDLCGRYLARERLGKIVWQKHGPLGTVVQEGTIVCCSRDECRTQAKLLQLHKSGILADPPPRPKTASEWIKDDAAARRAHKKFRDLGRPFGDLG